MRRVAAAARRTCGARLASGGPGAGSATTHYETLGVAHGTRDATEIKAAFRRRARELHPDARGATLRGSVDDAGFVELIKAYEVLSCPQKRALYEAEQAGETARGSAWRASAARAAQAGDASAGEEDGAADGPPHWGHGVVRDPRLRRHFNDALARAYHGPPVDMAAAAEGIFPAAFEGEERAVQHLDLLQLVSGRTLLGVVRHVALTALAPGGTTLAASCGASPEAHGAPRGEAGDFVDELRLLSHTGEVVARAQRRPRPRAAPLDARAPPWSVRSDEGAGAGDIAVFLAPQHDAPHCRVRAAGGAYGVGSVLDAAGTETHTAVLHSTPWVTHLHFLSLDGRCRCRAVRAWLPPSALWLFAPRAESHNCGGWAFELPLPADRRRAAPAALHPAVAVLTAAFYTLDRERGRRSGMLGAAGSALTWLRSRLGATPDA